VAAERFGHGVFARRARFTSRPAARNLSTRSKSNRRESGTFTNGGSAEQKRPLAKFAQSDPEPRERRAVDRANWASRGGSSIVSGSSNFCDGAEPGPASIGLAFARTKSVRARVLVPAHESAVGLQLDVKLPMTPTKRKGTFNSGVRWL